MDARESLLAAELNELWPKAMANDITEEEAARIRYLSTELANIRLPHQETRDTKSPHDLRREFRGFDAT